MITEKIKAYYLKKRGLRCPYCKSNNISAGDLAMDEYDGLARQPVACLDCDKQWEDILKLVDLREYE